MIRIKFSTAVCLPWEGPITQVKRSSQKGPLAPFPTSISKQTKSPFPHMPNQLPASGSLTY